MIDMIDDPLTALPPVIESERLFAASLSPLHLLFYICSLPRGNGPFFDNFKTCRIAGYLSLKMWEKVYNLSAMGG